VFWDQPTISVPVGMALAKEGVYVSSHGKVSLLRYARTGTRAEREEVVASGWPPTDVASGGVDATAVTLDRDGNIYFGLIAADYSNPYRVKDGVSHYDLNGKRGTIQKLSKAGTALETIATGTRVQYALAFNKAGDLFCTDQEGETWCPNGNPLDELNHIVRGKNYGFPPRHEKWLPEVQSESPVVGFGPQHESACGLVFNEPRRGQGLFGPKWWEGDAFVAGESRGKIWRVHLVKTARGYIGKEFPIARLSMLTTDVTISPAGALYVCCHSGEPDWGTGPKGPGKIFKISYTDPKAPQPVYAWAAGATQLRVAFDRKLDGSVTNQEFKIEFGDYVRAGDRFERLKPPYKVVKQQEGTARGNLNVVRAEIGGDKTLVLATDPHPLPVTYALTIPGVKAPGISGTGASVDIEYDLSGNFSQRERTALVRDLPDGSHIARERNYVLVDQQKSERARYPFIHPATMDEDKLLELAGGDYERGAALFRSEKLKCVTCHRLRGEGATIGPDLSNVSARDAASVLRDIKEPSASIHPDYVAYAVTLKSGAELTGFLRAQDEQSLRLVGADGKESRWRRTEVAELRPSPVSLMPSGLLDGVSEGEIRDLLTYLLTSAPQRGRADLQAVLKGGSMEVKDQREFRIVLVASQQDHGPGQHDYPAWQKSWHELLSHVANVVVSDAWLWPNEEEFSGADVIVFYYWNHDWNQQKFQQLDKYLARGGGIVTLHSGTIGTPDPEQLALRIGLASDSGKTKYLHTPADLNLAGEHPIVRGLPKRLHFVDEPYWPMIGDTNKVEVLANVELDGGAWPMMWTYQQGLGRTFSSIFGHYTWTLEDPLFRLIIVRGIAWAGGRDVNRLEGALLQNRESRISTK
jgi:putative heme-binding domain-containing protein